MTDRVFSDEGLERLKEKVRIGHYKELITVEAIEALIARLEAAELVGAAAHAYLNSRSAITRGNYLLAEDAWRKAAGKARESRTKASAK